MEPAARLDPATVPAVARWADRLRTVFEEEGRLDQRVLLVNALLADAVRRPFVSVHDGLAPHWHYADVNDDLVKRLRARTAAGLAHVLCDGDGDRLGHCARQGCALVSLDTSRNGTRRSCTLRCANRVRTAEHRERLASS